MGSAAGQSEVQQTRVLQKRTRLRRPVLAILASMAHTANLGNALAEMRLDASSLSWIPLASVIMKAQNAKESLVPTTVATSAQGSASRAPKDVITAQIKSASSNTAQR